MLSREKLEEWVTLYGKAASSRGGDSSSIRNWSYPYFSVNLRELGVGAAVKLEWILTNGLGGYSSSTLAGLNTRRCHGLLVSSSMGSERRLLLGGVEEEVSFGGESIHLWLRGHEGGVDSPGKEFLGVFKHNLDSVSWLFDLDGVVLSKRVEMVPLRNAVVISYDIENSLDVDVVFKARPLTTSRTAGGLLGEGVKFKLDLCDGHTACVSSTGSSLLLHSEGMECSQSVDPWVQGVSYGRDGGSEGMYAPVVFTARLAPKGCGSLRLTAVGGSSEREVIDASRELSVKPHESGQRILSSGLGGDLIAFTAACDSFIVDHDGSSTILAGYHTLGERGRDVMMSIPGLALASGRFNLAEKIFGRFLGFMKDGRIPSGFRDGLPEYCDFDSTLWLVNSLNEYRKCAGDERFGRLIRKYWHDLEDALDYYIGFQRRGLLSHESGTWMATVDRDNAVEVQGLWYNALRIMDSFNKLVGDRLDVSHHIKRFEENFMPSYWNGSYLKDTLHDDSLRPNQLLVISLDHHVLGFEECKSILDLAARELLTLLGLRTLARDSPSYVGRLSGSMEDVSCYNGAVWPWLAGPYFRALMKLNRARGRSEALAFVKDFIGRRLREGCIGTVGEFFDGDQPHTPHGHVSHALNTAELMRVYREASGV